MNVKSVICVFLLIGYKQLEAGENVTKVLDPAIATNQSVNLINKKIDVPRENADSGKKEEASSGFISSLSNLIFGRNEDAETSDTHQVAQYGPPPPRIQQECNPCNKEPWIPITTNYGHNTLVGFMQPHDMHHSSGGLYNQHNLQSGNQISGGYGAPLHDNGLHTLPAENYGPPPSPHIQENFRPPSQSHNTYGAPDVSIPSIPQGLYGAPNPPKDNFDLPLNFPSNDYGPPPPTFNPPKPQEGYGPPPSHPSFGPPGGFNVPPPAQINFGNHYGAPKPIYKIPQNNYGPPNLNQPNFGVPKPFYGPGKSPRQIRPGFNRPHMQFGGISPQPVYKYIPLNKGKYSNLPTNFKPPPPPPNYNSGGPTYNNFASFVNHPPNYPPGDIKTQITNPEYLPPPEQLPISTEHEAQPIPFPNLSPGPVAPLHNPQNFHDNFPQPGSNIEIPYESPNVQIQQSIPIADFLASVEHPINIIRAPIFDVNVANTSSYSDDYYSTVKPYTIPPDYQTRPTYAPPTLGEYAGYGDYKLSENPIVVEDTYAAAATNANKTVSNYDNLHSSEVSGDFINQILQGISDFQTVAPSTSMQPPPRGESPWMALNTGRHVEEMNKKPKQIQIIIPYTTNNNYDKKYHFGPGLPVKEHTDFYAGSESKEVTAVTKQPPTTVINIQELFKNNKDTNNYKNLPFDVIRLQKNIDGWTEQEYSKNMLPFTKSSAAVTTSTTKFIPSKRIPDEYLTTLPYNIAGKPVTTTSRTTTVYHDHEPAGSNSKEYLESNLIATTEPTTTPKFQKLTKLQSWEKIHIAVSPLTKEKIYVVTPQPKSSTATANWRQSRENERNSTTFSISIIPMRNKTADTNDVRVVLSEWPHLINNLATTVKAQATTTQRPTSRHPLFGLMDLSSYSPPANSTIETYSGHSKVINVATASLKKRGTSGEKKATTTMKSPTFK